MTAAAAGPVAVLVLGAGGQLGVDLCGVLPGRPGIAGVRGLARADLDVTDPGAVTLAVRRFADRARAGQLDPIVVNAAAWTDVDGAERDEAAAFVVNAAAPAAVAAACATVGAALVHLSTDYVFGGDASEPYEVDDPPAPRSAYGRTKLAGERAVLAGCPRAYVVRTAWVYGRTGRNFVRALLRLERERDTVSVVADQHGAPTWSRALAGGLADLVLRRPAPGVLHCTNAGSASWYELARAVFVAAGADPDRVQPTTTVAFPRPAPRPAYSVLSTARWRAAGLAPLAPWRQALEEAFRAGLTPR